MQYKAVIFDLDGTLLDSIRDIANFANIILMQHGFPTHPPERYVDFIGNGAKKLVERALPEEVKKNDLERIFAEYLHIYEHKPHTKSQLYVGIPELLNYLEEKRLKKSILTNKPHAVALKTASDYFGAWTFDRVQGQETGKACKPDPTSALDIAAYYALPPEDCVFIGDSTVDVRTGKAAGMQTIAIEAGYDTRTALEAASPDLLVAKHKDLIRHLSLR